MARSRPHTLAQSLRVSLLLVCLLFAVFALDTLLRRHAGATLHGLGIFPRTVRGLPGILFGPLLHASPAHLLANALPLFVLLLLLFWDRHYRPWLTLLLVWLASGFGTWLIGRASDGQRPLVHLGASSLIFGLVTYLVISAALIRSWRSAAVALVVLVAFGGIFYGIVPQTNVGISWEAHLSGAVAGAWAARANHD